MFQLGNFQSFWKIWDQHIPIEDVEKNETQRLIFTLQLYFAVFPLFEDEVYFFLLQYLFLFSSPVVLTLKFLWYSIIIDILAF